MADISPTAPLYLKKTSAPQWRLPRPPRRRSLPLVETPVKR